MKVKRITRNGIPPVYGAESTCNASQKRHSLVHQLESTSFNRNLAHRLCIVDLTCISKTKAVIASLRSISVCILNAVFHPCKALWLLSP